MGSELKIRNRRTGFTLIELIVVLLIVSLAMMLVIPRLPSSEASKLKSSARTLAATIRYLGENSVTGRVPYRLQFNFSDASVAVARRTADGGEATPDDVFLAKRILAEGITIESIQTSRLGTVKEGQVLLDFGPAGMAEFIAVHLQGGAGKYTVIAFPGSGKVKIHEGYQEAEL